jgi:hypothetical protein
LLSLVPRVLSLYLLQPLKLKLRPVVVSEFFVKVIPLFSQVAYFLLLGLNQVIKLPVFALFCLELLFDFLKAQSLLPQLTLVGFFLLPKLKLDLLLQLSYSIFAIDSRFL